jgi:hypothetical protein
MLLVGVIVAIREGVEHLHPSHQQPADLSELGALIERARVLVALLGYTARQELSAAG